MAAQLTEYERRRLENIRRNDEMMASLKIRSKLSQLSSLKRQRVEKSKSYKVSPEKKKSKSDEPIVIRRSLRTRGIAPDSSGLSPDFLESSVKPPKPANSPSPGPSPRTLGPLTFRDSSSPESRSNVQAFTESILSISSSHSTSGTGGSAGGGNRKSNKRFEAFGGAKPVSDAQKFDLSSLELEPENVARVVPGRVLVVRFFPSAGLSMVAVGNKFGNVGFWDMNAKDQEGDGIYLFRLHSAPVSGIQIHPLSISKVYTSCYDGFVRVMNVEKEVFDLVHSSDDAIFSLSQNPEDPNSIYFGSRGVVDMWDERMGKVSASWNLHENRINSIDFNPANTNAMATSSTDATACIWDLRKMGSKTSNALMTLNHNQAVHSAYFSPAGTHLASTSVDDNIGVASGKNYEDVSMIRHNNQTGRWISSFRGIWGWDDEHIYVGNMGRGVDVLSVNQMKAVYTLQSPHMTAIPCRFDAHPSKVGALAGTTAGGQVYVWTSSHGHS